MEPLLMIGVPNLNNTAGLRALIDSVDLPALVCVVDNGFKVNEIEQDLKQRNPERAKVHMMPGRGSVAASWNGLMRYYAGMRYDKERFPLIICNDDIIFRPGTLKRMREDHIRVGTPNYTVMLSSADWSCFMINPIECWARVGRFDEAFYPAYYEDADYDRRLKLAGPAARECYYPVIHTGSATINAYPEDEMETRHHRFFRRNQNYYIAKWGGLPGEEIYRQPFENEYWEQK